MKTSMKISLAAVALASFCLAGCSKWTQPEHIDYRHKTTEEQDPQAWEQYLSALRSYKSSEHNLVFVTMQGTSKHPVSRSQHIMAMPDSADVICVDGCENLHPAISAEISEVESKKGTKVISNVDLAVAYADWLDYKVAQMDSGRTEKDVDADAPEYFTKHAESQLAYCDEFGFGGIQLSLYVEAGLTAEERANCLNPFAAAAGKWKKSHPSHLFNIRGNFNNVADQSIIDDADYLIVILGGNKGVNSYKTILRNYKSLSDESKGKLVFETLVPSSDNPNPLVDLPYTLVENLLTKDSWGKTYDPYTILGIAVSNAQDDYFNENWYDKNDLEKSQPIYYGTFVNIRRAAVLYNTTKE